MYRHLLILPDGTEVFSGLERKFALQSVTVTQAVNSGTELTLGSVCAGELQADILITDGELSLFASDAVVLYRVDEDNSRQKMGVYYLEKPERPTAHTMRLTAYDAVSLLDKDLTQWLLSLDQWPYTLREFADLVCEQCGLVLETGELPNHDFYIQPFSGAGITGRHLMQWIGQVSGRFCRATPDGTLEMGWYCPNETTAITPSGGNGSIFYYQGELHYEAYLTAPVEKVQLRQEVTDVGTVWPNVPGRKNTYIIESNPLLTAQNADSLLSVAETLFAQLQTVGYTPCKVTIPATPEISAGDVIAVTDIGGKTFPVYVMKKISNGQRDTLECSGSYRRDSTSVVNNADYRVLSGKVLTLQTNVDGLKVENRDTQGKLSGMEMDLEGIRNRVERQSAALQAAGTDISILQQTAKGLSLELETIREEGTDKVKTSQGYTFDDTGLHICRSDSDMDNTIDHRGMYVRRSNEVLLKADNRGVEAADVTVRNYLIVGTNTRFEDYNAGRTACYYIG